VLEYFEKSSSNDLFSFDNNNLNELSMNEKLSTSAKNVRSDVNSIEDFLDINLDFKKRITKLGVSGNYLGKGEYV